MEEMQAKEEIQLIRSMLEKTKRATAESGTLFIVWGMLITLALMGNYVLAYFKKYDWEWLNWIIVSVGGWIYSAIYGIRKERQVRVRTYIQSSAYHLYFACGTVFLLVGLAFPALHVYSYEAIPVLIAVVSGLLFFVMGGIYEWPFLKWTSVLWWIGAVGMALVRDLERTLIFTGLFIAAFLVPSFIFRSKYKKQQSLK